MTDANLKSFPFILIDDNSVDTMVYGKMLTLKKVASDIISFNYAGEAVLHLHSNTNLKATVPTIILLDIQMPVMNCFAFLDEFDKLPENIKEKYRIMVLSSSVDKRDMDRARENKNVLCLLGKPLVFEQLANGLSML